MAKVLIHIKGGLVQWAISDENVSLEIIDSDTDGSNEENLTSWTDADGYKMKSHVYGEQVVNNPSLLDNIQNSFDESQEKNIHD